MVALKDLEVSMMTMDPTLRNAIDSVPVSRDPPLPPWSIYGRVRYDPRAEKPEDWTRRAKFQVWYDNKLIFFAQKRHARQFCTLVGVDPWRIRKGPHA